MGFCVREPRSRLARLFAAADEPSTSEPLDMALRNTGTLLKRLRALMKNTTHVSETIQAYIVPSGDAHQVRAHLGRLPTQPTSPSPFLFPERIHCAL